MTERGPAARSARTPKTAAPLAAYVLHRYDWSESSLILDLYTRGQGRLAVVAKGAKRPYSQLRGVLLPFQRLHVVLGRAARDEGASEVRTLRSAEWAGGSAMLTGAALFSGFYVNELLLKLLARQDPHDALFDAYAATLPELGAAQEQPVQAALRAFELTALREIGLLPDLSVVTLTQQPVRPGGRYSLSADAGVGGSSGREAELGGDHLIGLQAALQHGSMAALQHACRACLAELKAPLRALVQHHVGSTVLRTRQALLDMHSL